MGINTPFVDSHDRVIRYIRLSVTDRCNLRCMYCAHALGLDFIPHNKILTYEEMHVLIDAFVSHGVDKLRLTGGEPFVRKGLISFLYSLREKHPALDIRITTNATMLTQYVDDLCQMNISAVNISFDTFKPSTFQQITGIDGYSAARAGLDAALSRGLRIKLNAVGLKGINDTELPDFIQFAKDNSVDVRFIEFMPLGGRGDWTEKNFWSAADILEKAQTLADLERDRNDPHAPLLHPGPAKMYTIKNGKGRFGLITPLTSHFCASCNRLRITSDGRFRTCLFSDDEVSFRDMLRDPNQGINSVLSILRSALALKPLGYQLLQERKNKMAVIERSMSSIGG